MSARCRGLVVYAAGLSSWRLFWPHYVLALKGNQSSLHQDVRLFLDGPVLAGTCATQPADIDAGHGRIKERLCRVADAGRLAGRQPK